MPVKRARRPSLPSGPSQASPAAWGRSKRPNKRATAPLLPCSRSTTGEGQEGRVTLTFTTHRGPAVRSASAAGRRPGGRHVVRVGAPVRRRRRTPAPLGRGVTSRSPPAPPRQHRRALVTAEYPSDGSDDGTGLASGVRRHRARALVCLRPSVCCRLPPRDLSPNRRFNFGRRTTACPVRRGLCRPGDRAGSQFFSRRYGFVVTHEYT